MSLIRAQSIILKNQTLCFTLFVLGFLLLLFSGNKCFFCSSEISNWTCQKVSYNPDWKWRNVFLVEMLVKSEMKVKILRLFFRVNLSTGPCRFALRVFKVHSKKKRSWSRLRRLRAKAPSRSQQHVKFRDHKYYEIGDINFQIFTWPHVGQLIKVSCDFKGGSLSKYVTTLLKIKFF